MKDLQSASSKASPHSVRRALLDAIAGMDMVVCRLPGREDVATLEEGLRWLETNHRQGFVVDYQINEEGPGATVWLKSWNPDDTEPSWPDDWPEGEDRELA